MRNLLLILVFTLLIIAPLTVDAVDNQKIATKSGDRKENILKQKKDTASKAASIKETREQKKEKLQVKLKSFKDKKKVEVVRKIDDNLNIINHNRTSSLEKFLEKLSDILDRTEQRLNSSGKDFSLVRKSLDQARVDISEALKVVTDQADKDYTVAISSESKAKSDINVSLSELKSDLDSSGQKVVIAHKTVVEVVKAAERVSQEK